MCYLTTDFRLKFTPLLNTAYVLKTNKQTNNNKNNKNSFTIQEGIFY